MYKRTYFQCSGTELTEICISTQRKLKTPTNFAFCLPLACLLRKPVQNFNIANFQHVFRPRDKKNYHAPLG